MTGVCVMRLVAGLDSGPVAMREVTAIGRTISGSSRPGSRRSAETAGGGSRRCRPREIEWQEQGEMA